MGLMPWVLVHLLFSDQILMIPILVVKQDRNIGFGEGIFTLSCLASSV